MNTGSTEFNSSQAYTLVMIQPCVKLTRIV